VSVLGIALLVLLPVLPFVLGRWIVLHGPVPNPWWRGETVLGFAATTTTAAALIGFFSAPLIWPNSNLGPPVLAVYLAPAGLLLGLGWGWWRAGRR